MTMNLYDLERIEGEEWKTHSSGLFVSNLGRVYVPKNGKNKEHYTYGSSTNNSTRYRQVQFKHKKYHIHRLIAECFIPNPNNYLEVDHINRDKTDNKVENLRWATRSMQNKNKDLKAMVAKIDYKALAAAARKALSKPVNQYTLDGEFIKTWTNAYDVQRELGFNRGNISKCCLGKCKSCYKYKWQYT